MPELTSEITLNPSSPNELDSLEEPAKENLDQYTLDQLRAAKSACDAEIIDALARRQAITDIIGVRKTEQGVPVRVISEEHRVLTEISNAAEKSGLNPRTVVDLWVNLFEDSRTRQAARRRNLGVTVVDKEVAVDTSVSTQMPNLRRARVYNGLKNRASFV